MIGGPEKSFPNCQCIDWKRTMLPCKHMVAIFQSDLQVSWDSLPASYRSSPFLSLDLSVIHGEGKEEKEEEEEDQTLIQNYAAQQFDEDESQSKLKSSLQIPIKKFLKANKASSCREILSQIKSLTYLLCDEDILSSLVKTLKSTLLEFQEHAPKEEGLTLEAKKTCKRKLSSLTINENLPKPKTKKSELSGRVGVSTEKRRMAKDIQVTDKNEGPLLTEEVAPLDDAIYDIPFKSGVDTIILPSVREKTTVAKVSEDEEIAEEQTEITITDTVPAHGKVKQHRNLLLSNRERNTIKNNQMLTDESINIAQNLLRKQFPVYSGFTDTVVGKTHMFDIIPKTEPYIQILHAGSLHWICVANTNVNKFSNNEHFVYDSLKGREVKADVLRQIASYSFCENDQICIKGQPVQQQQNGVDCGIFSIAFATSLANGKDPTQITYDTSLMCTHFLSCLQSKKITELIH